MAQRRVKNLRTKKSSSEIEKPSTKTTDKGVRETQRRAARFNDWHLILLVSILPALVLAFHTGCLQHLTSGALLALGGVENASSGVSDQASNSLATGEDDLPDKIKKYIPRWQKTISVNKVFADGRRIHPLELIPERETNSSVKLYLFENFLSERECNGLMRAHDKHVREMSPIPLLCFDSLQTLKSHLTELGANSDVTSEVFTPGTLCLNASFSGEMQNHLHSNWSYSTAFYPQESKFSTVVADRIKDAMGLDPDSGGKFQITSYPVGKAYKTHTDCSLGGTDLRDRVASVIIYLNDITDGGETKFPDLDIAVTPRKGQALVWNNMSPEGFCEPQSRHVASVVRSGSKYILIRWYYYKSFYSIGKRMADPPLPPRDPGVPMVRCDLYTHGSCRWYDEWSPTVMTDYTHNDQFHV